jgi:hypothetical protein
LIVKKYLDAKDEKDALDFHGIFHIPKRRFVRAGI